MGTVGNYINGFGSPKIRIVPLAGGARERILHLPDCNEKGEPESSKVEGLIVQKLYNGDLIRKRRAVRGVIRITWKFFYDKYIIGTDCLLIQDAVNSSNHPEAYKIFLTPYYSLRDIIGNDREFETYFSSEIIEMDILHGEDAAPGMYFTGSLDFTTVQLVDLNWLSNLNIPLAGREFGGPIKGQVKRT